MLACRDHRENRKNGKEVVIANGLGDLGGGGKVVVKKSEKDINVTNRVASERWGSLKQNNGTYY